jgi:hypothetical protein
MKKEMLKFLNGQFPIYFEEREIIRDFIETFFKNYQPERLSPEDHVADASKMVCDSPNTANK